MLCATLTLILFVICFSATSCRVQKIYLDQNEVGVTDIYGFIDRCEITDELRAKICDREVAVVSKGFLFQHWVLKQELKDYKAKYGEIY